MNGQTNCSWTKGKRFAESRAGSDPKISASEKSCRHRQNIHS